MSVVLHPDWCLCDACVSRLKQDIADIRQAITRIDKTLDELKREHLNYGARATELFRDSYGGGER